MDNRINNETSFKIMLTLITFMVVNFIFGEYSRITIVGYKPFFVTSLVVFIFLIISFIVDLTNYLTKKTKKEQS